VLWVIEKLESLPPAAAFSQFRILVPSFECHSSREIKNRKLEKAWQFSILSLMMEAHEVSLLVNEPLQRFTCLH
jgi:hypothetical protein